MKDPSTIRARARAYLARTSRALRTTSVVVACALAVTVIAGTIIEPAFGAQIASIASTITVAALAAGIVIAVAKKSYRQAIWAAITFHAKPQLAMDTGGSTLHLVHGPPGSQRHDAHGTTALLRRRHGTDTSAARFLRTIDRPAA